MCANLLKVDSLIPFGGSIVAWVELSKPGIKELIAESRKWDKNYLAWQTVRKGNPFLENGTGFEGYFVGTSRCPEEVFANILAVGNGMLTSILRLYRFDHPFRAKMERALTEEVFDPKVMSEWSAQFGAALARLRCTVLNNKAAGEFRAETYRKVGELPPIDYKQTDHDIHQLYVIDLPGACGRQVVNIFALQNQDQDAWFVAQNVGKFGHPIIRSYIRHA